MRNESEKNPLNLGADLDQGRVTGRQHRNKEHFLILISQNNSSLFVTACSLVISQEGAIMHRPGIYSFHIVQLLFFEKILQLWVLKHMRNAFLIYAH